METINKGKAGQIGEIRTWAGKKYQKTAKGWRPVAGNSSKTGAKEPELKKEGTVSIGEKKKPTERPSKIGGPNNGYKVMVSRSHIEDRPTYLVRTAGGWMPLSPARAEKLGIDFNNLKLSPPSNTWLTTLSHHDIEGVRERDNAVDFPREGDSMRQRLAWIDQEMYRTILDASIKLDTRKEYQKILAERGHAAALEWAKERDKKIWAEQDSFRTSALSVLKDVIGSCKHSVVERDGKKWDCFSFGDRSSELKNAVAAIVRRVDEKSGPMMESDSSHLYIDMPYMFANSDSEALKGWGKWSEANIG